MMTTKTTYVPELRFPEFSGEWQEKAFGEICNVISEKGNFTDIGNYVSTENMLQNYGGVVFDSQQPAISSLTKYRKGDILFSNIRPYLKKVWQATIDGTASNDVIVFRTQKSFDECFVSYVIKNDTFIDYVMASAKGVKMPRGDKNSMLNYKISFPTLPEQRKIASCLSSLDDLITHTRKKIDLLKQHKKGLMQKLFPRSPQGRDAINRVSTNQNATPELRFQKFSGDWQVKRLGDFLNEHKLKSTGKESVYSVSVSKGLVNQIEHLGRCFAAADTSKYNLVKPYDIVYTKSPTGNFPYGIVKQSQVNENVIVSPLYGVFSPTNKYIGYIIHCYFESIIRTNNYLESIIKKGARNTIQITNDTFLSKNVLFPTDEEEQQKLAKCLYALDKVIEETENQIRLLEQHKKGLMQKMFVK